MASGAIQKGISGWPNVQINCINQTGQTLYPGNIVELDWYGLSANSLPNLTVSANNQYTTDEVNIAVTNATIPTSTGIAGNAPYGVVNSPVAVKPGGRFSALVEGMVAGEGTSLGIQVNPFYAQTVLWTPTPTGGTFTITMGAVTTAAITWSATAATLASNITAALDAAFAGVSGTFLVTGTNSSGVGFSIVFYSSFPFLPSAITTTLPTTTTASTVTNTATGFQAGTKITPVAGYTFAAPMAAASVSGAGGGPGLNVGWILESVTPATNTNNAGLVNMGMPTTDPNLATGASNQSSYVAPGYTLRGWFNGLPVRQNLGSL